MGEILDSLNALPSEAIAERAALRDRQNALRKALQEIEIAGSEEIKLRWSEQAGTKAPEDKGKPVIPSVTESGGMG
jgi:hypothetical protein